MSDEASDIAAVRQKQMRANGKDLYEKAKAHMQIRKQLEESTPEGCTFKPDTGLSKDYRGKGTNAEEDVDVAERLYREASLRKAKMIDSSLTLPPECSFTPCISVSQSWSAPNRGAGRDGTSCPDTPTRLYNNTRQIAERREALVRKGEEEMLAQCTFTPAVTKARRPASAPRVRPSSSSTDSGGKQTRDESDTIANKLYKDASARDLRMKNEAERVKRQIEIESNVAVAINKINSPTSPTITANNRNTKSSLTNYDDSTNTAKKMYPVSGSFEERMKSADERVSEKIRQKKEQLLEKERQECTFAPKRSSSAPRVRSTSGVSVSQAESQRPESPAHIRLIQKGEAAQKKIELSRLQKIEDEKKENTFQPTFLAKTPRHGQAYFDNKTPFFDRFARQSQESEQKKAAARARADEAAKAELTYTPTLLSKKGGKRATPAPEGGEFTPTVFDRLAAASQEKRLRDEAKIKSELEKDMTFQPQIDRHSQEIEVHLRPEFENVPIYDRLIKEGARRSSELQEVKKLQEEGEIAQCTFRPDLSQSTESLLGVSALLGRTPSPARRGSYMMPTQTWQAHSARPEVSAKPVKASSSSSSSLSSSSASSSPAQPGASPGLRRRSFLQPTKASQARDDTTAPPAKSSMKSPVKTPLKTPTAKSSERVPGTASQSTQRPQHPPSRPSPVPTTGHSPEARDISSLIPGHSPAASKRPGKSIFDSIMAEHADILIRTTSPKTPSKEDEVTRVAGDVISAYEVAQSNDAAFSIKPANIDRSDCLSSHEKSCGDEDDDKIDHIESVHQGSEERSAANCDGMSFEGCSDHDAVDDDDNFNNIDTIISAPSGVSLVYTLFSSIEEDAAADLSTCSAYDHNGCGEEMEMEKNETEDTACDEDLNRNEDTADENDNDKEAVDEHEEGPRENGVASGPGQEEQSQGQDHMHIIYHDQDCDRDSDRDSDRGSDRGSDRDSDRDGDRGSREDGDDCVSEVGSVDQENAEDNDGDSHETGSDYVSNDDHCAEDVHVFASDDDENVSPDDRSGDSDGMTELDGNAPLSNEQRGAKHDDFSEQGVLDEANDASTKSTPSQQSEVRGDGAAAGGGAASSEGSESPSRLQRLMTAFAQKHLTLSFSEENNEACASPSP